MVKRPENNSEHWRLKGLLPFQVTFIHDFTESKDGQCWEFVSPVGSGKINMGVAIIDDFFTERKAKRVLLIAPASILTQWQLELSSRLSTEKSRSAVLLVNRGLFLELQSKVPVNETPWPEGAVVLISIDLAKREDIMESLCQASWDLVIFDESHLLSGMRGKLFEQIRKLGAARHTLLLSATPFLKNVVTRKFKVSDIKDWDGKPIYKSFERRLIWVHYLRSQRERQFLESAIKFTESLARQGRFGKLQKITMMRTLSSSIYSAEVTLRRLRDIWTRLRNKLVHGMPTTIDDFQKSQLPFAFSVEDLASFDELSVNLAIKPEEFLKLYQHLMSLIDTIQDIEVDSKLNVFINHINTCFEIEGKNHICVWTSFTDTMRYLTSSVQDIGKPIYVLSGSTEPKEREHNMDVFRKSGGILIATDVALEGTDLSLVDQCINYDVPLKIKSFEQRWGRFLRVGRKGSFEMVILRDDDGLLYWEEEFIERIQKHFPED